MKLRFGLLVAFSCFLSAAAIAADWRPVDPSELAQKTPRVEPGADAEAIFWDVKIEDSLVGGSELLLSLNHYIRIKIYTDLGREKYATVEIPRSGKRSISSVAGRTIKPDGTIIELRKDAIFDRELVKTKGLKLKGTTFTLPNVAPGDIIEYRYKETHENEVANMRLYFQRDLPLWSVTYHLKPLQLPYLPFGMRSMAFQCNHPPFQKEPDGFFATTMTNMPAFREEPDMPPEDQLRAWMLIYYEEEKKLDADKFWRETGKNDFNRYKPLMHADGLVKQTAAELTAGTDKPEDKLGAIDSFCRTKIRHLGSPAFHLTADERKAVKENHSPGDTLKQKAGWGTDVNLLFAALANAAGFDARMARVPDRGDTFFNRGRPTTYFMEGFSVAVKVNDKWTFFDPSTPYLERGMLRWQEEGQQALISDPKEGFFAPTQYSEPVRSERQRRATFKLLEDGSLEGDVQYTYTGHEARDQKVRYEDMTPAQQEENWKQGLQGRLSTAEMSGFEMKDIDVGEKPFVVHLKVTVPGYATRTGKRLLLQPAFFERNLSPRYTESKRKWDLYFDYGWADDDEVTIDLPEGWELDQPMAPVNSNFGAAGNYRVSVLKTTDGKKLIYKRHFEWGRGYPTLIPADSYPQVKKAFDFVQEQDNYTIALKAVGNGN